MHTGDCIREIADERLHMGGCIREIAGDCSTCSGVSATCWALSPLSVGESTCSTKRKVPRGLRTLRTSARTASGLRTEQSVRVHTIASAEASAKGSRSPTPPTTRTLWPRLERRALEAADEAKLLIAALPHGRLKRRTGQCARGMRLL